MNFRNLVLTLWTASLSITANSSEIDSFIYRDQPLKDSSEIINMKTNEFIQLAIQKANKKKKSCHKKTLYKEMRKYLRNHVFGELSKFAIHSPLIDKREISIRESIYSDFSIRDAIITGYFAKRKDLLGKIFQMGPYTIGTDKLEHMMGSGLKYYKKAYLKKKGIPYIIKLGQRLEGGILGTLSTGVYSYADQVANFNGMRFWNHVLAQYEDVLGENFGPYISCQKGSWRQVKKVNLLSYMDHAWDEGINCSKYRTWKMVWKVNHALGKLSRKNKKQIGCPANANLLDQTRAKYKDLAKYLLNDKITKLK